MRALEPLFIGDGLRSHTTPSICSHALRLHGLEAAFADPRMPSSAAALTALCDSKQAREAFAAEFLIRTRYGVRHRPSAVLHEMRTGADESHQDQTLAALLDIGVPLDHPLLVAGEPRALRDVLRDAVANYVHGSAESEWSSLALILGLPPARSWTNRFGERFAFDDMVRDLLERDPSRLACAGTHVLYALVVLLRVHEEHPILSNKVHERLSAAIEEKVALLEANQHADGSWDLLWYLPAGSPARANGAALSRVKASRALATSHIGECLVRLPEQMRPVSDSYRRCAQWLWQWLQEPVPPEIRTRDYCPYIHAACVVQLLRSP